jgi:phosphonopyruvate decarboxylase
MTTVAIWHEVAPESPTVACVGFMGGASSLGLGLALARPERRVIVLDGDGSLLMQLGSLSTIAGAAPANLTHLVFKNGVYHTSGGQAIPGRARIDFAAMARGAGYRDAWTIGDLEALRTLLPTLLSGDGPLFAELETVEAESSAPPLGPQFQFAGQAERLRLLLGEGAAR